MTDIGILAGTTPTEARAINTAGQVVGSAGQAAGISSSRQSHAVLWQQGAVTEVGADGGDFSVAQGINLRGQIVGYAGGGGVSADTAFLWYRGVMTSFGTLPGGGSSYAYGINAAGQVVGWAHAADGSTHAFVWQGGVMTDPGRGPGGENTYAFAVNDAGVVVGRSGAHAALWHNGVMTDLGSLDGRLQSSALSVNAANQVVGNLWYTPGRGVIQDQLAFLWQHGVMTDLNELIPADMGWRLTEAHGINDSGQIVGTGMLEGQQRAFLLTPRTGLLPGTGEANPASRWTLGSAGVGLAGVGVALRAWQTHVERAGV